MDKTCKQKEHKWVEISSNPWRYQCSVCKVIGKIKFKKKWKQSKVQPITNTNQSST